MDTSKSGWQTAEVARAFLDGVRGAIPASELQLEVIGRIAQAWCPEPATILDLGCGDGILGRYLLDLFPAARAVFVDFSEPMLDAARQALRSVPQATVAKADFATPEWLQAVDTFVPLDIVVSGFAIHHQPDARKQELYREIFGLLKRGGVFLNLEHVASASEAGERLFDEFFVDHLHQFHYQSDPGASREDVANAYYRRSDKIENILAPVAEQCQWLREIGFRDVDCFYRLFELALFGGRKECAPRPTRPAKANEGA